MLKLEKTDTVQYKNSSQKSLKLETHKVTLLFLWGKLRGWGGAIYETVIYENIVLANLAKKRANCTR